MAIEQYKGAVEARDDGTKMHPDSMEAELIEAEFAALRKTLDTKPTTAARVAAALEVLATHPYGSGDSVALSRQAAIILGCSQVVRARHPRTVYAADLATCHRSTK